MAPDRKLFRRESGLGWLVRKSSLAFGETRNGGNDHSRDDSDRIRPGRGIQTPARELAGGLRPIRQSLRLTKRSMKRVFLVLVLALAAGLGSFMWMRSHHIVETHHETLLESMPELAWLRKELDLNDSQFEKVRDLHAAYLPECSAMCQRIAEAHVRLDEASQGKTEVTPELKSAIADHSRIHAECQERMLAHLYETARILDADQAERYLEVMLPYALDFSQSEPEDHHVR